jgi:hypothetical protein
VVGWAAGGERDRLLRDGLIWPRRERLAGASVELLFQFGIKANRLDSGRRRAERRAAAFAVPRDRAIDVVAGLGFLDKLGDDVIVDRRA